MEELLMKKLIKNILAGILVLGTVFLGVSKVNAATFNWSITKNPGSEYANDIVTIPVYKGRIYFNVKGLSGDCSCLIAKCESLNSKECVVDNSLKCVRVTKPNASDSFTLKYYNGSEKKDTTNLLVILDHNASIGTMLRSNGTITF